MPDWQELREAGKQIRRHTMRHLDFYLEQFERNCTAAGGVVHWARDAEEARQIVVRLVKASGGEGGTDGGHQDQVDDDGGDSAEQGAGGGGDSCV